jgi:hypothetical protein
MTRACPECGEIWPCSAWRMHEPPEQADGYCDATHEVPGSGGTLHCRKAEGHAGPHVDYHGVDFQR